MTRTACLCLWSFLDWGTSVSFGCLRETQLPQLVPIMDSVEELSELCFRELKKFSVLHLLNHHWRWLARTHCMDLVLKILVPDSVEELCGTCFYQCTSLSRVPFGDSFSLKMSRHSPDSVGEVCESCFCECESLYILTLGASSSLKMISKNVFPKHSRQGEFLTALKSFVGPRWNEFSAITLHYWLQSNGIFLLATARSHNGAGTLEVSVFVRIIIWHPCDTKLNLVMLAKT